MAAEENGMLILEKGTFHLTSSLFLKSNMEFHFEGVQDCWHPRMMKAYPMMDTRVAGIEMKWYPGFVNVRGQKNVTISGKGVIDGQGEHWWAKYWGR
ncbi:MAG: hypothetical protein ACLR6I_12920 [Waltera sp.]